VGFIDVMTEQEKIELFREAFRAEATAICKTTKSTADRADKLRRNLFKAIFGRLPTDEEDYKP
jgi:hypothetical protein